MLLVAGTLLLLIETSDLLELSLEGFVLLSYVICSLEKTVQVTILLILNFISL